MKALMLLRDQFIQFIFTVKGQMGDRLLLNFDVKSQRLLIISYVKLQKFRWQRLDRNFPFPVTQ